MCFLQDDAPPHYCKPLRDYLYENRWIGRRSTIYLYPKPTGGTYNKNKFVFHILFTLSDIYLCKASERVENFKIFLS